MCLWSNTQQRVSGLTHSSSSSDLTNNAEHSNISRRKTTGSSKFSYRCQFCWPREEGTLQASLSGTLPPSSAVAGYASEGALALDLSKHFSLRPQKRGGLLGTGRGVGGGWRGGKSEGSIAHSNPEDREGRGLPPEQQKLSSRECTTQLLSQLR